MNRGAKFFYIGLFILFGQCSYAQTDIVTLSRVKDFINAGLTHIILSNDSIRKDSGTGNWKQIDTVLQKNTLEKPVYYAALSKLIEGKYDSVLKKFSSKFDRIDIAQYANLNQQGVIQTLYDTAFSLLNRQYNNAFSLSRKDSVYLLLINKAKTVEEPLTSLKKDTIQKPLTKKTPEPAYVPWYAKFQGFLFWLLACVLISVALFLYCLDQIRQLKGKLNDTEKTIMQMREEKDPLSVHSGPVTTVYTEFRNLVTLKIKELYDIIDHLNMRIITLERKEEAIPTLQEDVPALVEKGTAADDPMVNEELFYMSVPIENYFPFTSRSLKKDALYKFTLTDNKIEARYEVINDGLPIDSAMKDPAKFFEPACVSENEPQVEVRVIITKAQGIAVFDGEKWAIQQKAFILFI